jgi:hypothetical protein
LHENQFGELSRIYSIVLVPLSGLARLIAIDASLEVADRFAETTADLRQLRRPENEQRDYENYGKFLHADSKHFTS